MAVIGHAEALAERIHRSARAASQSLVAAWQASGQCGPAQPRALSEARFWQAARERINVRTGPATIYAELGQVQLGAVLPIRGDLDGAWVPVTAPGGQRGWVYGELGLGLGAIPCPLTVDGARPICAAPSGESCDPVRLTDGGETLVIAAGPRRGGYIPLQLGPSRVGWLSPP